MIVRLISDGAAQARTAETRDEEASDSKIILGLDVRDNLGMRDGFFVNDEAHQLKMIQMD